MQLPHSLLNSKSAGALGKVARLHAVRNEEQGQGCTENGAEERRNLLRLGGKTIPVMEGSEKKKSRITASKFTSETAKTNVHISDSEESVGLWFSSATTSRTTTGV